MKRVLVLMASRNGAEWIEAQVASILAQRDVEVRLVVGDDVSTDGTPALLAARWGGDPRVEVVVWETPSGSAGANFLRLMRRADATAFDAVALADQDDLWFPDKLAVGAAALDGGGPAGYSSAVEALWSDGRKAVLAQDPRVRRADFLFEGAGQGCTFVLARPFFERVQRFLAGPQGARVDMHFHDWMLYTLSRAWGEAWIFDPVPRMRYRQHGGNDIGARGGSSGFTRRLRMIRDGWYARQIGAACTVYLAAGGADPVVRELVADLRAGPGRGRLASARLARRLLGAGRRRGVDRAILFVAALMRWI